MRHHEAAKKPAAEVLEDWHPADVVAAIHKAGTTLSALSRQHGYHARSLQVVLRRAWPRGERIVAARVGLRPQAIWPSRYHADGRPRRDVRPTNKHSTANPASSERAA
jgi:Ner family transcriptional regulator